VVRAQARRAPDLAAKVAAMRIGWRLMSLFGIPGSIVAGLSGLSLLDPMGFGFRPGWVHASVGIWAVLLLLVLFYLAPRLKKTLRAGEASLQAGAPTDELKRLTAAAAPRILGDVTALGIVVLVLLMVLKPF
jgi:uncharacterized membrane protein